MFYQEDLEECGLDVTEAMLYSGVCTQIFKRENTEVLEAFLGKDWRYKDSDSSLDVFLMRTMKKSLKSQNGHLDLFVRFFHGLSIESNQRLFGGLLGHTGNSPEIIQRAINNLKEINSDMSSLLTEASTSSTVWWR
ncbi:hypothetical protein L3Q82_002869 [Scortum barcoo]|uniref:Uncharacterized protein n=1 Tax=Scortum barcoo TaxID=214431 RepID=A0ACB8VVY8_9TELE|nr:hypothetical protein L3Q82_002869 [Scortum barcoo]